MSEARKRLLIFPLPVLHSIIQNKGSHLLHLPTARRADFKQDLLISKLSKVSDVSCLGAGNGVDSDLLKFDKMCKMPKDACAN